MEIGKTDPRLREILENSISENDSEFKNLDLSNFLKIRVTANSSNGNAVNEEFRYIDKKLFDFLNNQVESLVAFDKNKNCYLLIENIFLNKEDLDYEQKLNLLGNSLVPISDRYEVLTGLESQKVKSESDVEVGVDQSRVLDIVFTAALGFILLSISSGGILFSVCGGILVFVNPTRETISFFLFYGLLPLLSPLLLIPLIYFLKKKQKHRLFQISLFSNGVPIGKSVIKQSSDKLSEEFKETFLKQ